MKYIHEMISRGMIQSLTIPQKKVGAGRIVVPRRTPDLRLKESWSYNHLPKILDVMSSTLSVPRAIYCGFDPTGASLHLGHMTVLSVLLNLARAGHHVIALVGGATALFGDPTGKKENRMAAQNEAIEKNALAIQTQLKHIFCQYSTRHDIDPGNLSVLNNIDWYKSLMVEDFIELVASEFKLNDMLDRAIVKSRLEAEESDMRFSEFIYLALQAYDWYQLHEKYGCTVQVGGHDQIGNMEDGYTYMWRKLRHRPLLAAITVPLVVTDNGEKLGKTAGNAIWLDECKTDQTPIKQYLMRLSQQDLLALCRKLTLEPTERLEKLSPDEFTTLIIEELLPLLT
ncbi:tyrosine--tRNA ligase, mitochondrial-like [Watersipora subatra]|uniref:tyrosine--tRNA ligase, mitochondrial-like n=1 Tax=Watersipora subatra TaxID=2589382 RepID=UPI00355BB9D2